jgi:hypothetical protein
LERQHLEVVRLVFIGKETNEILEETEEVITYPDAQVFGETDVTAWLGSLSPEELRKLRASVPERTLRYLKGGGKPTKATVQKLKDAMNQSSPSKVV